MTGIPPIGATVPWADGLVLRPGHFRDTDRRTETLFHVAGLGHDPWAFGFTRVEVDEIALASDEIRLSCEGVLPGGRPFRAERIVAPVENESAFEIQAKESGGLVLVPGGTACSQHSLPAVRVRTRGGARELDPGWSPPALIITPEHPLAADAARSLGSLAGLASGFAASLRIPGSDRRPGTGAIARTHAALAEHVGMMDWVLTWPVVSPTALAVRAVALALAVRAAARIGHRFEPAWDPADQRGSLRAIFATAEAAASSIGLPFRTRLFRVGDEPEGAVRTVEGVGGGSVVVAVESARAADLPAVRHWFEGAALAAPERIEDALTRRVGGVVRRALDRDPEFGIASGPLVQLYRVDADPAWRGCSMDLAIGSRAAMPCEATFSVFVAEPGWGYER